MLWLNATVLTSEGVKIRFLPTSLSGWVTTAIISCLTKSPVDKNVAMTGEVTLRGNVLPIGGLKEKSLAAHRSGIKTICIPKGNVKDLDEVPQTVKDDVKYIPVEKVDQVIAEALV